MSSPTRSKRYYLFYLVIFAVFGAMMYISRLVLAVLPNIHLVAMFIMTFTAVYRVYALIPIYIYVFLEGFMSGFSPWWIPYIYIWTVLWAICMLLPKNMQEKTSYIVYPVLGALHGILFGVLYVPIEALMYKFSFAETITWLVKGFWYDVLHGIGNFAAGFLVYPFVMLLKKLDSIYAKKR